MDPSQAQGLSLKNLPQKKTLQPQIPQADDLMRRDKLFITVKSPDNTVFTGEAVALSSLNDVGPFDVLPRHENFISILSTKIVIYFEKNQKQEFQIQKGIIKARQNVVQVFLGIETLGHEKAKMFTPPNADELAKQAQNLQNQAQNQKKRNILGFKF